jgi:2-C-methyl-D-erythritol 2,4-cyclodiphosphate synthase
MRVGLGFDVHRLEFGRPLILGGVVIPHDRGLMGHSDADVLVHALMDALLGAVGEGDIGRHFPDRDPAFSGADSMGLLNEVLKLVEEKGFVPVNVDAVVMAEEPKLAPFNSEIRFNLAKVLGMGWQEINIKASTTEKLGFVGKGEGIAAQVIVLLREKSPEDSK